MPGKLIDPAPKWAIEAAVPERLEYHLTTITPMFGGGAIAPGPRTG
ncbi:MAG: hypothetical protein KGJ62_00710 [Armatimonadetes bacterium]|nr:hypothetical protein [Armatimonadota bacterium]MDE2205136.1 hypothetical protein [Armatimonadota bacterium]